MRAKEFLYESDSRSRIEKLLDMIDHPSTESTVKQVAISKLKNLLEKEPPVQTQLPVSSSIACNIKSNYMDENYVGEITFRDILNRLAKITPCPTFVEFLQQKQIIMRVEPPFGNQTRDEYFSQIAKALPGITRVSCDYKIDSGYDVFVSWI